MTTYSMTQIQLDLLSDPQIRTILQTEANTENQPFETYMTDFIYHRIIKIHSVQTVDPGLLDRLIQQKHDRYAIAQAIAHAWVNQQSEFQLQKVSLITRIGKKTIALTTAILITLVIAVKILFYLRHDHPELVGTMLVFEPILALGCILLTTGLYYLFKWLFRLN